MTGARSTGGRPPAAGPDGAPDAGVAPVGTVAVTEASAAQLGTWDRSVRQSVNGTLFHRLDFLAYHGARFADRARHLVVLDGAEPIGRLSVTVTDEEGGRVVRSPYGGSYGGLALARYPSFAQATAIVDAVVRHLGDLGADRFVMTPPIACCSAQPLDTLTYAFLAAGFVSTGRDVSSVCPLDPDTEVAGTVSTRARNMARKAEAAGVKVEHQASIDDFWPVMEAGYLARGRVPTHTKEELDRLMATLPGEVWVDVGWFEGVPVAGVCYFAVNDRVNSSFYLCHDPAHARTQALSLVVLAGLERSRRAGYRAFDFGLSTNAMVARPSVFVFKESFTRVGVFRETFEWRRR